MPGFKLFFLENRGWKRGSKQTSPPHRAAKFRRCLPLAWFVRGGGCVSADEEKGFGQGRESDEREGPAHVTLLPASSCSSFRQLPGPVFVLVILSHGREIGTPLANFRSCRQGIRMNEEELGFQTFPLDEH